MSAKFSLETVLRYRTVIEKRELNALDALRQQAALLQAQLSRIKAAQQQTIVARESSLGSGTIGSELHHLEDYEKSLEMMALSVMQQIEENAKRQEAQILVYQKAHIDCEVLGDLKEKHRIAHIKEQEKREQRAIDDLMGARSPQES